jgi:hypothetical protein
MNADFAAFLSANATTVIIVLGLLGAWGIFQWRKVRIAEQESELKRAMIERGTPITEVERAVAVRPPTRRGWIDQFGGLSGGAKAGIIVAFFIFSVVTVSCIAGTIQAITFWSRARDQQYMPPRPPEMPSVLTQVEKADSIAGHAFYLDLQPVANQKLTDITGDNKHSLGTLPQKRREFGGVPFQVGPEYVRLRGNNRKELSAEANNIRVGFAFDKLHIFHGAEYGAIADPTHRFHVPEGTEIGHYRVRYTDDNERVIPIVYGEDVRDIWDWDKSRRVSRGRVVWTGKNPHAQPGVTLQLFLTTWTNPRPTVEVAAIDFISAGDTNASPFCVALTAERSVK